MPNIHFATMKVRRRNVEVHLDVEADVEGDIVAIQKAMCGAESVPLDDNETSAARCLILDKIYPKQGWDRKAAKLLEIALKYPSF